MRSIRRQHGMSMIAIVGIVALVTLGGVIAVRLFPIWIDYWTVVSVAESIYDAREEDRRTRAGIRRMLDARFGMNNMYHVKPSAVKIKYDKQNNLLLHIHYEDRRPVFGNLEVVATFDRTVGPNH